MQRGRARGNQKPRNTTNTRPPRPRHPDHPSVPDYASIHPGSGVSIVLKEDQPTGHRVHGIVADLLTRGDHPRGIKVRLRDGRVGRVQGLVSEADGEKGEAIIGGSSARLGQNGEGTVSRGGGFGMKGGRVERDIREDDEYLYDENRVPDRSQGLFFALEEADQRHRESRGLGGRGGREDKVVKCAICGEFEGDEWAVAHHVEGHFDG